MSHLTVLKLGGSAITDKSKECTPNLPLIQHATEQIVARKGQIILLHGGGSYAHPVVARTKLHQGYREKSQLRAISETELYLDELSRIIGVSLLLQGIPFAPIRPMSFLTLRNGSIEYSFLKPVESALQLGLVPLIHGDLAFDSSKGCGIASADRLASLLGIRLHASRVLFGCDVDGVYSENPKTSQRTRLIEEVNRENAASVLRKLARDRPADATGGMLGKVKEALRVARSGRECYIFNLLKINILHDALQGKLTHGTRFVPWNHGS